MACREHYCFTATMEEIQCGIDEKGERKKMKGEG
jgi:hypothetical protein